uniref:substrate-binding domain-containing protein n=1 Tax=Anaerosporobacter sp. TaxID=1872529 RepID=UPI00286F2D38
KFDAVQCYNDQIAHKIMLYLNKLGMQVPEDVSITGYDNSLLAETASVKLTTIAHPKELLGELAAKLLLEKIAGIKDEESKVERVIEPELIIRDSCMKREL